MLKIVSVSDCAIPAARSAANDEPYSTMRRSSRSHQTRCGMRCTSGPAPVTIDERQTGVSDGKTDVARRYAPCSARCARAGARPLSTACSNASGVIPSTTIRTSFFGTRLVLREGAQAGVALGLRTAETKSEHRNHNGFEVAHNGDEREACRHEGCTGEERRRAPAGAPTVFFVFDDPPTTEKYEKRGDSSGQGIQPPARFPRANS